MYAQDMQLINAVHKKCTINGIKFMEVTEHMIFVLLFLKIYTNFLRHNYMHLWLITDSAYAFFDLYNHMCLSNEL